MSEFVFFNDGLAAAEDAQVSIYDAGLLHGVGLFETMRSYEGVIFRLEDHLERMFHSAEELGFIVTQKREEVAGWLDVLLEANDLRDARIRLTMTRGSLREVSEDNPGQSVMFATASAMTPYPPELFRRGMTVIVSETKQNPTDPTARHKTLNYFSRLVALQEAQKKQAGEAIWMTTNNHLAEGSISNVFLIKDEKVLTPPLDTPVLAGITRKVVLELAEENEMESSEQRLVIQDLLEADEVFLTNSIMELMPVCRIERHAVGKEKPGPIYTKLHDLYRQAVEEESRN
jgi:branched-chain amino acid aminotransferase